MGEKKVSLDDIGNVRLPSLDDSSGEEAFYQEQDPTVRIEHKQLEGSAEALNVAKQRNRKLTIENDDLARLGPHRRRYSWCIFAFVICFVSFTLALVWASSYQIAELDEAGNAFYRTYLYLDKEVLMTLLATNTVQVVGLLYIVAKWLFQPKPKVPAAEEAEPTDKP